MATKTGSIGAAGTQTSLATAQPIGITMDSSEYPNGAITFGFEQYSSPLKGWYANASSGSGSIIVYLCDSAGNNKIQLFTVTYNSTSQAMFFSPSSATISNSTAKLKGKELYLIATGDTGIIQIYADPSVTVNTSLVLTAVVQYNKIYATDRSQIGTTTNKNSAIQDSHFSTGTTAKASTFNSQVLGL